MNLGMNAFINPWTLCPSCHQYYQNELVVDIATKFVSFVQRQYPRDTQKQVEALQWKLHALGSMFERLQPVQKRETGVTINVLLSLIDRLKTEFSPLPLPKRYSQFESTAYYSNGRIALKEGSEESARRAEACFEKSLQVCEAIGDADGIATAKSNIADAKLKYEGGNNDEELVTTSQELYELHIAEHGDEHYYTIISGKSYAINLQLANRRGEARELLTKLLATSKQVLGLHHKSPRRLSQCSKRSLNLPINNDRHSGKSRLPPLLGLRSLLASSHPSTSTARRDRQWSRRGGSFDCQL
jgi:hypothetical protein